MNRRAFVTLLSSGLVAFSLPPLEWIPGVPDTVIAPDLTTIDGITSALVQAMAARAPDLRGLFIPGALRIGEHGLRHQFNIAVEPYADGRIDQERCIKPAAHALMQTLSERGLQRFGALPTNGLECDAAVAMDERSGLCVRGIRQYALVDDFRPEGWRYRFDVVAG
jgi:hypothetical protein